MMNGLKHIKDRPGLKDKQQMQARVLSRIAALEDKRVNQRMIWWRMAASILVLFLVGSYSWLEINTYINRTNAFANIKGTMQQDEIEQNCEYRINELLISLQNAGFVIDSKRQAIQFTKQQVIKLGDDNSPHFADINQFLVSMEKLYPLKYQQYNSGEAVELNSWQLKKDQRLCDWVK